MFDWSTLFFHLDAESSFAMLLLIAVLGALGKYYMVGWAGKNSADDGDVAYKSLSNVNDVTYFRREGQSRKTLKDLEREDTRVRLVHIIKPENVPEEEWATSKARRKVFFPPGARTDRLEGHPSKVHVCSPRANPLCRRSQKEHMGFCGAHADIVFVRCGALPHRHALRGAGDLARCRHRRIHVVHR